MSWNCHVVGFPLFSIIDFLIIEKLSLGEKRELLKSLHSLPSLRRLIKICFLSSGNNPDAIQLNWMRMWIIKSKKRKILHLYSFLLAFHSLIFKNNVMFIVISYDVCLFLNLLKRQQCVTSVTERDGEIFQREYLTDFDELAIVSNSSIILNTYGLFSS